MFKWFKELLKGEEPEEFKIEDYIVKCPKCGSTNIGYFTGLVNFVEAMRGGTPHFKQTATCLNCKYKVESAVDELGADYLKQMELVPKNER